MQNKIIALIVGLLMLLFASLQAQITFERTYGNNDYDFCFSIIQRNDRSYVFSGASGNPFPDDDVLIMKVDSLGDSLWAMKYGGDLTESGNAIIETFDGGFLIAGQTESFGAGSTDVYLLKIDSLGDSLWARTYGGPLNDVSSSIRETSDSNYVMVGNTQSFGAGRWDIYLLKVNPLGDTLWTRTYGGIDTDYGRCVLETPDKGYLIVGSGKESGPDRDVFLIKTDSLGNTLWTRYYGGNMHDIGHSIVATSDGGYAISGQTCSFSYNLSDVYLVKVDSLGDSLWGRNYYEYLEAAEHCGYSVQESSDGGYFIAGYCEDWPYSSSDVYLIKTDTIGNMEWSRLYGGFLLDKARCVQKTLDGGYIIGGYTYSFGGLDQAYLIKTNSQGNVAIKEGIPQERRSYPVLTCSPNPFNTSTTITMKRL